MRITNTLVMLGQFMKTIEQAINDWDVDDFITKICFFCEYVVQDKGEKDFRKHLLEEHKEEIKEHFEGLK